VSGKPCGMPQCGLPMERFHEGKLPDLQFNFTTMRIKNIDLNNFSESFEKPAVISNPDVSGFEIYVSDQYIPV
jgi:hypothetical protein